MNNIYKEHLNIITEFEIPYNAFDSDENLKHHHDNLTYMLENALPNNKKLLDNALKSIYNFCRLDKNYVLHKFKEYYAISEITDMYEPQEISDIVQVFDENRTYPIQQIEIKLDFKYRY